MRTLEQCKAEVFRRSEEKIRKRKVVRRCVIAACLPLCLFMSFWAVMILPAMMPASADNAEKNGSPMELYDDTEKEFPTSTATVAVVIAGETHPVAGEDAFTAAAFLPELEYSPAKVCKCLPQFRVITDSGDYGIHLGEGYARCDRGQAKLTPEQITILQNLLYDAEPTYTTGQKIS